MSNIKKAVVRFNGQELVATYDDQTKLWTATATAPSTSSYGQPDHVYKAEVFAQDQAGNSATVNSSDPTYGAQLKIRVLEKTKPEGQIRTPSNGSVLGVNTQNVLIAVTDNGGSGLNNAGAVLTSNFTISTAAPALNITSPADNLLTNSKTITVAGAANTHVTGVTISRVTIKVDSGNAESVSLGDNGSFSKAITIANDGRHTITIVATDSLGKTTQVVRNVTIDTTKPVITDIHASATTVDAGGRIVFTFKVIDANV